MSTLHYWAVYCGQKKASGHTCVVRGRDAAHALHVARRAGIILSRNAYARRLTVQDYAQILRSVGLKVAGVPEQLALITVDA